MSASPGTQASISPALSIGASPCGVGLEAMVPPVAIISISFKGRTSFMVFKFVLLAVISCPRVKNGDRAFISYIEWKL